MSNCGVWVERCGAFPVILFCCWPQILLDIFIDIDRDGSGELDKRELKKFLTLLNLHYRYCTVTYFVACLNNMNVLVRSYFIDVELV